MELVLYTLSLLFVLAIVVLVYIRIKDWKFLKKLPSAAFSEDMKEEIKSEQEDFHRHQEMFEGRIKKVRDINKNETHHSAIIK